MGGSPLPFCAGQERGRGYRERASVKGVWSRRAAQGPPVPLTAALAWNQGRTCGMAGWPARWRDSPGHDGTLAPRRARQLQGKATPGTQAPWSHGRVEPVAGWNPGSQVLEIPRPARGPVHVGCMASGFPAAEPALRVLAGGDPTAPGRAGTGAPALSAGQPRGRGPVQEADRRRRGTDPARAAQALRRETMAGAMRSHGPMDSPLTRAPGPPGMPAVWAAWVPRRPAIMAPRRLGLRMDCVPCSPVRRGSAGRMRPGPPSGRIDLGFSTTWKQGADLRVPASCP